MSIKILSKINQGYSDNEKYCVMIDHKKYLLRISPLKKYNHKLHDFEMMKQVMKTGIPMPQPYKIEISQEKVHLLLSWIDGYDAEEIIPNLTSQKQYNLGLEAGKILKKIHSIPIPSNHYEWENLFNSKIDKKLLMYNECPLKYKNDSFIINYINKHRYLLKDRPMCFQHGDYHTGNMIINNSEKLYIIDFDRCSIGDPWEEFNRIVWCVQKSPLFASGLIDGYFDNCIPSDFWQLLALYICTNTLSSLPWSIPFGLEQTNIMKRQAKDLLYWYDNFKSNIPNWYSSEYRKNQS